MRQDSTVVDTIHVHDNHTWVSGVGRSNATSRYYFQVSYRFSQKPKKKE